MTDDLRMPGNVVERLLRDSLLPRDMLLRAADAAGVAEAVALRRAAFARLLCEGSGAVLVNNTRLDVSKQGRDRVAARLGAILRGEAATPDLADAVDEAFRSVARLPVSPAAVAAIRAWGLDPARAIATTALAPHITINDDDVTLSIEVADDDPPSLIGGTVQVDQLLWVEMNGTLWLDATLPGTVLNALPGEPLSTVLQHPVTNGLDLFVALADHEWAEGRMRIVTRPRHPFTVGDIACTARPPTSRTA